ncbi:hypothetical protein L1887_61889, partial [Cichorium endivia]
GDVAIPGVGRSGHRSQGSCALARRAETAAHPRASQDRPIRRADHLQGRPRLAAGRRALVAPRAGCHRCHRDEPLRPCRAVHLEAHLALPCVAARDVSSQRPTQITPCMPSPPLPSKSSCSRYAKHLLPPQVRRDALHQRRRRARIQGLPACARTLPERRSCHQSNCTRSLDPRTVGHQSHHGGAHCHAGTRQSHTGRHHRFGQGQADRSARYHAPAQQGLYPQGGGEQASARHGSQRPGRL